jgi:hypothetical protein
MMLQKRPYSGFYWLTQASWTLALLTPLVDAERAGTFPRKKGRLEHAIRVAEGWRLAGGPVAQHSQGYRQLRNSWSPDRWTSSGVISEILLPFPLSSKSRFLRSKTSSKREQSYLWVMKL